MKHIVEEHCFLNLPAFPVDVCNGTGHKTTALTGNVPVECHKMTESALKTGKYCQ